MSMEGKTRTASLAALVVGSVVGLGGCETKGPAQRAGEKVDGAIQDAKDAVNPPGPGEKVGRDLDRAINK
jgi:hypothetical protein